MGIQTMNFLKAIKASWFFYSLFGLLAILAIFETFWFYFFANLLTVLSLKLAMKRGEPRKCGENGWQEIKTLDKPRGLFGL